MFSMRLSLFVALGQLFVLSLAHDSNYRYMYSTTTVPFLQDEKTSSSGMERRSHDSSASSNDGLLVGPQLTSSFMQPNHQQQAFEDGHNLPSLNSYYGNPMFANHPARALSLLSQHPMASGGSIGDLPFGLGAMGGSYPGGMQMLGNDMGMGGSGSLMPLASMMGPLGAGGANPFGSLMSMNPMMSMGPMQMNPMMAMQMNPMMGMGAGGGPGGLMSMSGAGPMGFGGPMSMGGGLGGPMSGAMPYGMPAGAYSHTVATVLPYNARQQSYPSDTPKSSSSSYSLSAYTSPSSSSLPSSSYDSAPKIEIGQSLSNSVYANSDALRYDLSSLRSSYDKDIRSPSSSSSTLSSSYSPGISGASQLNGSPSSLSPTSVAYSPVMATTFSNSDFALASNGYRQYLSGQQHHQQNGMLSTPALYNRLQQYLPYLQQQQQNAAKYGDAGITSSAGSSSTLLSNSRLGDYGKTQDYLKPSASSNHATSTTAGSSSGNSDQSKIAKLSDDNKEELGFFRRNGDQAELNN